MRQYLKGLKFQVHKNNCIQRYQEPEGCCRWLITDFDSCWATSVMIRQVEEWRQFSRLFCPQKDNWKAFMWNKGSIGLVPVFDLCEMLRGGVTGLTFDMTWSIIKFRTSKTEYVHTVTQIYGVLFKIGITIDTDRRVETSQQLWQQLSARKLKACHHRL